VLDIETIKRTAEATHQNPVPFGKTATKILSKLVVDLCDVIQFYESLVGKDGKVKGR